MLTSEENDLLCRVEGDAPMGQIMRRALGAGVPDRGGGRAGRRADPRADARRGARGVPRHRRQARRAGRILPASPRVARAMAATRNAACAASITAGRWTWKATWSRWRRSRRKARCQDRRSKRQAYPAREAGGFVWTYMGPPDTMPEFEPPAVRADA